MKSALFAGRIPVFTFVLLGMVVAACQSTSIRVVDDNGVPLRNAIALVQGTTRDPGLGTKIAARIVGHSQERLDFCSVLFSEADGLLHLSQKQLNSSSIDIFVWAPRHATAGVTFGELGHISAFRWTGGKPQQIDKRSVEEVGLPLLRVDADVDTWASVLHSAGWDYEYPFSKCSTAADTGSTSERDFIRSRIESILTAEQQALSNAGGPQVYPDRRWVK